MHEKLVHGCKNSPGTGFSKIVYNYVLINNKSETDNAKKFFNLGDALCISFFTVKVFPLRNTSNFFGANQQFYSSCSVIVFDTLANVAFGKFL